MKALIICFSYSSSPRFRFKKKNCEADLHRVRSYMKEKLKCDKIETITDFDPTSFQIKEREEFIQRLKRFCDSEEKIFLYISGHAIREMSHGKTKRIKMILPNSQKINSKVISQIFEEIKVPSIIILDICHSESFMTRRLKDSLFIGATQINQTCGFFRYDKEGSLFSYFLIKELREMTERRERREVKSLLKIDLKIDKIRSEYGKSPQNIVIISSSLYMPSYLSA